MACQREQLGNPKHLHRSASLVPSILFLLMLNRINNKPHEVIQFCRNILLSCLNRLQRVIMHVSFDVNIITHNEVSYSLNEGIAPIIHTKEVWKNGGWYLLLEEVLGFKGNYPQFVGHEPELAILFFNRLESVEFVQTLKNLLDILYIMGKKLWVRSICCLVQSFRNFIRTDTLLFFWSQLVS